MGVTLTDVLLFGKAQSDDVDNATLVIYRRNILRWSALGGYLDIIVKGVSPLSLPDAIADSLSYVKAFGETEQRNIPQPYTQVNYVTNTAQTAVNTGIMIDFAKNYEFEVECRATAGSWYILQSRATSSGNITGIHGATSGSTITLVVGNVTVCTSAITRTVGNKLYVKATLNAGTATLYVKDETANTEDTQTGSYGTSQPNPTAAIYLLGNAGEQYVDINSDIYMARIKENDTVVMDYVPARQSATAGFYDTASGTFKTALTPANLVADGNTVPTPDAPMDIVSNNGVLKVNSQGQIYADGTVETIEVIGKNLLNTRSSNLSYYGANSGTLAYYSDGSRHSYIVDMDKVGLSSGDTVTLSCTSRGTSSYWSVGTYASITNGATSLSYDSDSTTLSKTFTIPEGANYIVVFNGTGYAENQMIERGNQSTTYEQYGIGSATAEILLKIGDYQDVQSILDGVVTKKVGVKVFDGTESWTIDGVSATYGTNFKTEISDAKLWILNSTEGICNKFNAVSDSIAKASIPTWCFRGSSASKAYWFRSNLHSTTTEWKQWLAEQYAQGTPVIVVYLLAESTTESVTGQTLQVQQGDNIVEITQASLSGLELEAKYEAAVSLTIQEVQDANLDPNVQVTIN